jgi:hypothetical protein
MVQILVFIDTTTWFINSRRSTILHIDSTSTARSNNSNVIECSNQPSSLLTQGTSWTLIYNGASGLTVDPGRQVYASPQNFSNSVSYLSYRLLIASKRGVETAAEYAEVILLGHWFLLSYQFYDFSLTPKYRLTQKRYRCLTVAKTFKSNFSDI